jgi:hypothetical protein
LVILGCVPFRTPCPAHDSCRPAGALARARDAVRSCGGRDRRIPAHRRHGLDEAFDYTLDPYDALRCARENELRALDCYGTVGQHSGDAEVQRLAAEFAAEETGGVQALDDWLARTPRPSASFADDPDRPAPA